MLRVEKTVFISYRRTNFPWAMAIFQDLNHRGYDVFFDYQGIASGDFESVILGNIGARAHFLVVLTPSALERCGEPGDWLRREIEEAIGYRRNIVPLMLEGFDFRSPVITSQLTGKLAELKHYQGLTVPIEFFDAAMEKLRDTFLNVPLEAVLHPAAGAAQRVAKEQQTAATRAPAVQEKELTAQEWFERGFSSTDQDEMYRYYSNAIRLKPDFGEAYNNRGNARANKGDKDGAIEDYTVAIRLKPGYADPYYNRGHLRADKGDQDGAIEDYTAAIRLEPDHASAYYNRGNARDAKGDRDGAIEDYTAAIRLKPDHANAYVNRGVARRAKGDQDGAIVDSSMAIRLKPDFADAYCLRGNARGAKGDQDGAIVDYTTAIGLKPDYALAYNNRGIARRAKGDQEGGAQDLAIAERLRRH
jgi:tetratricopeptide (TPR) repeat protein